MYPRFFYASLMMNRNFVFGEIGFQDAETCFLTLTKENVMQRIPIEGQVLEAH